MSHVMCNVSCVNCNMSIVTCHVSPINCHLNMSLMSTTIAMYPPPANSPTIHSRGVSRYKKNNYSLIAKTNKKKIKKIGLS